MWLVESNNIITLRRFVRRFFIIILIKTIKKLLRGYYFYVEIVCISTFCKKLLLRNIVNFI
jgi:hypothetical protein